MKNKISNTQIINGENTNITAQVFMFLIRFFSFRYLIFDLKLCLLLLVIASCNKTNRKFYEYNDFIFGSYLRIKITADDSIQAQHTIAKIQMVLYHIDSVASIFNPRSEISQINKVGGGKMSEDLKALIIKSLDVSDKSNGAFDITVGPAMKAYGFYQENQKLNPPQADKYQKLEEVIGYKKIQIKNDSIFLKPGMMLDLGGIAVGYALDKVYDVLKSDGIKDGLIDAGGDIICFGNKSYKIGIKNPKGEGIIKTITLKNQAISTSGNYEKFFEKDNKKFCHIINPKTTNAIADTSGSLCSVTIIADKCVDADAYATAVFVLGLKDGQNLIRKLRYKGILITHNGKMIEVKGCDLVADFLNKIKLISDRVIRGKGLFQHFKPRITLINELHQ